MKRQDASTVKIFLSVLPFFLTAWLFYYFSYQPQIMKIRSLKRQNERIQENIDRNLELIQQFKALDNEQISLFSRIDEAFNDMIPIEDEISEYLSFLTTASEESGIVQLQYTLENEFSKRSRGFLKPESSQLGIQKIPIRLEFSSDHNALFSFLYKIEASARLVTMDRLSVQRGEFLPEIDLRLAIYSRG